MYRIDEPEDIEIDSGSNPVFSLIPHSHFNYEAIVSIACGHSIILALTSSGQIYSFGVSQSGALGLGPSVTIQLQPSLIHLPSDPAVRFVSINTGPSHCAAICTEGNAYTWGYGGDGRLGHGESQTLFYPELIPKFISIKIVAISCG